MPRSFKSAKFTGGERGFSLIELSIAILIALFLLGGLVTLLMGTRRTNATQSSLSQLQDNERIAMTLVTNVVQKAGYFADPVGQQLSSFIAETTPSGIALLGGQVLGGSYNATPPGDILVVRFFTPQTDPYNSVINCAGQSNTAPSSAPVNLWYTNIFQIGTVNGTRWLQCQVQANGVPTQLVNLIPNVTNISVLYGVASGGTGDDYSIVQYLNATQVTAGSNWPNVTAVKVTLTFQVPNYGNTGGQMLPSSAPNSTTSITRVIPVMSRAGVNT
jgi:type IV pilus assembly protein PilW